MQAALFLGLAHAFPLASASVSGTGEALLLVQLGPAALGLKLASHRLVQS